MKIKERNALLSVVFCTVMWGSIGLFVRSLDSIGMSSTDIAGAKYVMAFIPMIFLALIGKINLKIKKKDLAIFAATGLCMLMMDLTWFYAQTTTKLSVATLLQMTCPFFVMAFSAFLFKEKMTIKKIAVTGVAFAGCILVTGVLTEQGESDIIGMLSALGSGLCFALYTIGGKVIADKGYEASTMLFCTITICAIGSLLICDCPYAIMTVTSDWTALVSILAIVFIVTLIPFYLYGRALGVVKASKASVLNLLEVITATAIGFAVFGEGLTVLNIVGMVLIMISVLVLSRLNE